MGDWRISSTHSRPRQ